MFGSHSDAALALSYPDEFWLGEGSTRIAYLINGIVYKVCHELHSLYDWNVMELNRSQQFAKNIPDGVRLPKMELINLNEGSVMAMEYVDGQLTGGCSDRFCGLPCSCRNFECIPDHILTKLVDLGWDYAYGNAVYENDGTICLIDIG